MKSCVITKVIMKNLCFL